MPLVRYMHQGGIRMIRYHAREQSFHLTTKNSSYLLAIYKGAYPIHLYWGARVRRRCAVVAGGAVSPL